MPTPSSRAEEEVQSRRRWEGGEGHRISDKQKRGKRGGEEEVAAKGAERRGSLPREAEEEMRVELDADPAAENCPTENERGKLVAPWDNKNGKKEGRKEELVEKQDELPLLLIDADAEDGGTKMNEEEGEDGRGNMKEEEEAEEFDCEEEELIWDLSMNESKKKQHYYIQKKRWTKVLKERRMKREQEKRKGSLEKSDKEFSKAESREKFSPLLVMSTARKKRGSTKQTEKEQENLQRLKEQENLQRLKSS